MFSLDDDDYIYPNHIVSLAQALKIAPQSPLIQLPMLSTSPMMGIARKKHMRVLHYSLWWSYAKINIINTFPIQAVMFKPPTNLSFDPALDALEDWMFWLQLMKDRTIVGIPKRTSAYRAPRPGSEYEKRRTADHHTTWIG